MSVGPWREGRVLEGEEGGLEEQAGSRREGPFLPGSPGHPELLGRQNGGEILPQRHTWGGDWGALLTGEMAERAAVDRSQGVKQSWSLPGTGQGGKLGKRLWTQTHRASRPGSGCVTGGPSLNLSEPQVPPV